MLCKIISARHRLGITRWLSFGYALKGDTAPQSADAASDLYALGVTLYQLRTGKLTSGEVLGYQTCRYYRDPTPPSLINSQVPVWLDHKQCFETGVEFSLALERGASRPVLAPQARALFQRDRTGLRKLALAVRVLFNMLLILWLLLLPTN